MGEYRRQEERKVFLFRGEKTCGKEKKRLLCFIKRKKTEK
jgi:hypothetical protein